MEVGVPRNKDILLLEFPSFLLHGPHVDHDASTHSKGASHLLYCSNAALFGGEMVDDCDKNIHLVLIKFDIKYLKVWDDTPKNG